ncbi:MAG: hypothetical protein U5R31_04410 [Acidimicrobiia bacterium]|nr:hypothetical protein [Acidimicrobiia bacterium]
MSVVEVGRALGVDEQPAGADALEAEGRPQHQSREAHPSRRRPEELGVVAGRDLDGRAVGQVHPERLDVVHERSGDVVVLAVDVGRDGAAHGHEAASRASPARTIRGARAHRISSSKLVPAQADDGPRLEVEAAEPAEPAQLGHRAAGAAGRRRRRSVPDPGGESAFGCSLVTVSASFVVRTSRASAQVGTVRPQPE